MKFFLMFVSVLLAIFLGFSDGATGTLPSLRRTEHATTQIPIQVRTDLVLTSFAAVTTRPDVVHSGTFETSTSTSTSATTTVTYKDNATTGDVAVNTHSVDTTTEDTIVSSSSSTMMTISSAFVATLIAVAM